MSGDLDTKRGREAARGENLEASNTIKEARLLREKVGCSFYQVAAFRRLINRLVQINTILLILSYMIFHNCSPINYLILSKVNGPCILGGFAVSWSRYYRAQDTSICQLRDRSLHTWHLVHKLRRWLGGRMQADPCPSFLTFYDYTTSMVINKTVVIKMLRSVWSKSFLT